jgi:hypothetical protein
METPPASVPAPAANPPAAPSAAIEVRAQYRIPLTKALALCWKGIKHRIFRSLLTLAVIVLAVAFFMSLLTEAAVTHAVTIAVVHESAVERWGDQRLAVWFGEPGDLNLAARLAVAPPAERAEAAAVSGYAPAALEALAADARRERTVLEFFGNLDAGSRAVLVHRARDRAVFPTLAAPGRMTRFLGDLQQLHLQPPLPRDELIDFISRYDSYQAALARFGITWRTAVAAFRQQALASENVATVQEWDAKLIADAGMPARFQALLAANHFTDSTADVETVRASLARSAEHDAIAAALSTDSARTQWKATFFEDPKLADRLQALADPKAQAILEAVAAETGSASSASVAAPASAWTAPGLVAFAARERASATLADLRSTLASRGIRMSADEGHGALLNGRQIFLMSISFLVCMVGIANAMLMAITERFREIATMKCLGATDGFILTQFLFEAAIQGAAGGAIGTVIGLTLALVKCLVLFGGHLFTAFPGLTLVAAGTACVCTGVLLSTLASIYPSWSASRMAPMDAMRVE